MRGPREGRVVARVPLAPDEGSAWGLVSPDGRILVGRIGRHSGPGPIRAHDLVRFEGGEPLADSAGAHLHSPVVGPTGLFLESVSPARGPTVLRRHAVPGREVARAEVAGEIQSLHPLEDGRVLAWVRRDDGSQGLVLLSRELEPIAEVPETGSPRVFGDRVAWVRSERGNARELRVAVHVASLEGLEPLAEHVLSVWSPGRRAHLIGADDSPGARAGSTIELVEPPARSSASLEAVGLDGSTRWRRTVTGDVRVVAYSGNVTFVSDGAAEWCAVARLEDGVETWSTDVGVGAAVPVLDRDGVLFLPRADDTGRPELVALAPSGEELFRLAGTFQLLGLDGFGRLLAAHFPEGKPPDLVAIT